MTIRRVVWPWLLLSGARRRHETPRGRRGDGKSARASAVPPMTSTGAAAAVSLLEVPPPLPQEWFDAANVIAPRVCPDDDASRGAAVEHASCHSQPSKSGSRRPGNEGRASKERWTLRHLFALSHLSRAADGSIVAAIDLPSAPSGGGGGGRAGRASVVPANCALSVMIADVKRSFVHWQSRLQHAEKASSRHRLYHWRAALMQLMLRVLVAQPSLHYYQGYHDVASVVLVLYRGDVEQSSAVLKRLTSTHLRVYCAPTMRAVSRRTAAVAQIVASERPDFVQRLDGQGLWFPQVYALAWLITWFSHDVSDPAVSMGVFDFLLAAGTSTNEGATTSRNRGEARYEAPVVGGSAKKRPRRHRSFAGISTKEVDARGSGAEAPPPTDIVAMAGAPREILLSAALLLRFADQLLASLELGEGATVGGSDLFSVIKHLPKLVTVHDSGDEESQVETRSVLGSSSCDTLSQFGHGHGRGYKLDEWFADALALGRRYDARVSRFLAAPIIDGQQDEDVAVGFDELENERRAHDGDMTTQCGEPKDAADPEALGLMALGDSPTRKKRGTLRVLAQVASLAATFVVAAAFYSTTMASA